MDKFTVYIFKGTKHFKSTNHSVCVKHENMSLISYLKGKIYPPANTKEFFNNHLIAFDSVEYTTEEIRQKVSEGMAIFPISETKEIKEVLNYIDIGLNPVFMKARDFQKLKKVYGDI